MRPLEEDDLDECEALCKRVHGFERTGAVRDSFGPFTPFVALRDGSVVAYAASSTSGRWPRRGGDRGRHEGAAARRGGAGGEPLALLAPLRSGLFRWALEQGLRASSR